MAMRFYMGCIELRGDSFVEEMNRTRCTRSNENVERYSKKWKIQNLMMNISIFWIKNNFSFSSFLIYILVDYRLWLNLFQTSLLLSFYFIFFLFKRPFITCISHLISILTMYNESIIERVPEDSLIKWWVIKTRWNPIKSSHGRGLAPRRTLIALENEDWSRSDISWVSSNWSPINWLVAVCQFEERLGINASK